MVKPSIPKNLVYRELDDELVILDLETSYYYSLNKTGAFIWKSMEKGAAPAEIAMRLAKSYRTQIDDTKDDVEKFLLKLAGIGLIKYEKK